MASKKEIQEFVQEVYATYNESLLMRDEKPIYRAWFALLHDLDIKDIRQSFTELATFEKFMPRPGDIRRHTINVVSKIDNQLDAYEAWGIFQEVIRNANSGTPTKIDKPESICIALRQTMKTFGDSAFGMHTNGDREAFVRVYEKIVAKMDAERYRIPEAPASN